MREWGEVLGKHIRKIHNINVGIGGIIWKNTVFMIDHSGKRINTKIHLPVAMYGVPIRIIITEDIAADCKQAEKLIDAFEAGALAFTGSWK